MQASVRILWVVASGVALALMLVASTPAARAYDGPTPQLIKAYHSLPNLRSDSEEGPVEMPRPIEDPPAGSFSATSGMTPTARTSGKLESAAPMGAIPGGRSAGPLVDSSTRAERSIRQVIRKLG